MQIWRKNPSSSSELPCKTMNLIKRSWSPNSKHALNLLQCSCSQGRKKIVARPGLEPRASLLLCEHSANWATEPLTFSPCLIRFVPKSAQNNGGTTKEQQNMHFLMLVALAMNPHWATTCHRGGKNCGQTGTPTQGLSLTMRALCQLSYRATWSSFDKV